MVLSIGSATVWPSRHTVFADGGSLYPELLSSIGTDRFYRELANVLAVIGGIEHSHLFRVDADRPRLLTSISHDGSVEAERQFQAYMDGDLWRADDTIQQLPSQRDLPPVLLRTITSEYRGSDLRTHWEREGFAERLMLYGNVGRVQLAMTAVRVGRDRHFGDEELVQMSAATNVLLPMVAKHLDLDARRNQILDAVTSLPLIEQVLASSPCAFPPRELQVCARLLYGLNAGAIAADLGIGLESVRSYRKRIYERMSIACYRELLLWYLAVVRDYDMPNSHAKWALGRG